MVELTLYQFKQCPFCAKVRAKLDQLGLQYKMINVSHDRSDSLRKELVKNSSVATVPILKIFRKGKETYLGESEAIINYLAENY